MEGHARRSFASQELVCRRAGGGGGEVTLRAGREGDVRWFIHHQHTLSCAHLKKRENRMTKLHKET